VAAGPGAAVSLPGGWSTVMGGKGMAGSPETGICYNIPLFAEAVPASSGPTTPAAGGMVGSRDGCGRRASRKPGGRQKI